MYRMSISEWRKQISLRFICELIEFYQTERDLIKYINVVPVAIFIITKDYTI